LFGPILLQLKLKFGCPFIRKVRAAPPQISVLLLLSEIALILTEAGEAELKFLVIDGKHWATGPVVSLMVTVVLQVLKLFDPSKTLNVMF
jgi:hypothetical protein